jgi:hypothetical protein
LGTRAAIEALNDANLGRTALFVGILLIIALYHFGISSITTDKTAQRVLAANALVIATHQLMVSGVPVASLLQVKLPWQTFYRIEYAALYLALPLGLEVCRRLFPHEATQPWIRPLQAVGLAFTGAVLVLPAESFTRTLGPLTAFAMLGCLAVLYVFVLAVRARRPQAVFLLFAASVQRARNGA